MLGLAKYAEDAKMPTVLGILGQERGFRKAPFKRKRVGSIPTGRTRRKSYLRRVERPSAAEGADATSFAPHPHRPLPQGPGRHLYGARGTAVLSASGEPDATREFTRLTDADPSLALWRND